MERYVLSNLFDVLVLFQLFLYNVYTCKAHFNNSSPVLMSLSSLSNCTFNNKLFSTQNLKEH